MALIGVTAVIVVLLLFATLCVDYGLRTLADSEVQQAADAAAVAGCERLAELPTALTDEQAASNLAHVRVAAATFAAMNPGSGEPVSLVHADIELGTWDATARTFAPGATVGANAVRVTTERSPARGNAVRTTVGQALGIDRLMSRRSAIARLEMPPGYALVGLEAFRAMGLLTVDGSPWWRQGSIASNGDVTLNLLGLVGITAVDGHISTLGDVHRPLLLPGLTTVVRDGVRQPPRPYVLPHVSAAAPTVVNDNGLLGGLLSGSGDLMVVGLRDLSAGTYVVDDLTIVAGAVLRVSGPATIYVRGRTTVLGTVLSLDDPDRFRVRVVGNDPVTIAANVTLSADIYAPRSQVLIAAGVVYRGRLMARRIDVLGTSLFFLRPDLPPPALGRSRVGLVD